MIFKIHFKILVLTLFLSTLLGFMTTNKNDKTIHVYNINNLDSFINLSPYIFFSEFYNKPTLNSELFLIEKVVNSNSQNKDILINKAGCYECLLKNQTSTDKYLDSQISNFQITGYYTDRDKLNVEKFSNVYNATNKFNGYNVYWTGYLQFEEYNIHSKFIKYVINKNSDKISKSSPVISTLLFEIESGKKSVYNGCYSQFLGIGWYRSKCLKRMENKFKEWRNLLNEHKTELEQIFGIDYSLFICLTNRMIDVIELKLYIGYGETNSMLDSNYKDYFESKPRNKSGFISILLPEYIAKTQASEIKDNIKLNPYRKPHDFAINDLNVNTDSTLVFYYLDEVVYKEYVLNKDSDSNSSWLLKTLENTIKEKKGESFILDVRQHYKSFDFLIYIDKR